MRNIEKISFLSNFLLSSLLMQRPIILDMRSITDFHLQLHEETKAKLQALFMLKQKHETKDVKSEILVRFG